MNEEDTNINETIENDMKNRNQGPVESKIRKKGKKEAKKLAKKARKKMRNTLFKKAGLSAIIGFFPLFIIIFMIVGIISFVTTMPGLVQEEILSKMMGISKSFNYWLNGSDQYLTELARDQDNESQKRILLYLDDMGIDPVGFGFAAFYTRKPDSNGDGLDEVTYETNIDIDDIKEVNGFIGAIRYNDEEAKNKLKEDLLLKYIISNERTYVVHDLDRIGNTTLGSSVKDWLGKISLSGMIETNIDSSAIGNIDDSEITVDRDNKQMIITSNNWGFLSLTKQEARYNLESWTGRYGMPLEFLLAIHIGTMTSDLTDEMLTNSNLQTTVHLDANKGEYDVDYEIKYQGHDLEGITRGKSSPNYELIKWKGGMEKYIVKRSDGSYGIDVADDELASLKNAVSINSLYEWLRKLRTFNLRQDISADFINDAAYDAKDAILGEDTFRVVYKLVSNDFTSNANWRFTSYYGPAVKLDDGTYSMEPWQPEYKDEDGNIIELYNDDGYTESVEVSNSGAQIERSGYTDIVDWENFEGNPTFGYGKIDGTIYWFQTGIIHGLNYYLSDDHIMEVKNDYVKLGIASILSQLDSFMCRWENDKARNDIEFVLYSEPNDGSISYDKDIHDYIIGDLIRMDRNYVSNPQLYFYLTDQWVEFWNANPDPTADELREELTKLMWMIEDGFETIDHRNENLQKVIDEMFEKTGIKEKLTIESIDIIHDALENNSDDFEFVFPRIKNVMRHWYKDVVFYDGSNTVYKKVDELRFPLKLEEENSDLEVTAVLTHKSGLSPYKQIDQPWVVKGDVVTVDGEIVDDSTAEEILDITDRGYKIGDGYRTTKKLFTQGQYYTYDGSQETAKSIWYAKQLEKLDGESKKFAKAYVQNGRIILSWVYDGTSIPNDFNGFYNGGTSWNSSAQNIDPDRKNDEIVKEFASTGGFKTADDGSWSVYLCMASISANTELPVDYYLIVANDKMNYVSAADNVDDSKKSVERINAMLEAMGVVTIRKPVSFDNTTVTGDVTTLTAFGLLENMHTEAAEYIYRDFKEFLIELGYYTKAEFEQIESNVLKWFIPDFLPQTNESRRSWNQAKEEDNLKYGAMIYPTQIDEEGKIVEYGFDADMDVIAPGNCRIIDMSISSEGSKITIEFDGISQPEIGALDKYTMIIDGIEISGDREVKVLTPAGDFATKKMSDIVGTEDVIIAEEVIGKTGVKQIQVVLKNRIGGYVNDIEDYMAPDVSVMGTLLPQEYQFTEDEKLLLAYVIQKEAAPEGLAQYMDPNGTVYDTAEEMAMAYAEAVGYVLINRTLQDFAGFGTKLEEQSSSSHYSGNYTIKMAQAADSRGEISSGSKQAAAFCAKYNCQAIVNPKGVEMTEDVTGESAWTFGHKIFWWLDTNQNGKQDVYAEDPSEATAAKPYPVDKGSNPYNYPQLVEWPWDGYLTYSD